MTALAADAAFYADGPHGQCYRCGDQNSDDNGICLTCTYPDDPCSRAWWDANPDALERMKNRRALP